MGADCPKSGTEIRIETRKIQKSDIMEFQGKFTILSILCTLTSIVALYFSGIEAKKMEEEIERRHVNSESFGIFQISYTIKVSQISN
jgi:hypothetical protein